MIIVCRYINNIINIKALAININNAKTALFHFLSPIFILFPHSIIITFIILLYSILFYSILLFLSSLHNNGFFHDTPLNYRALSFLLLPRAPSCVPKIIFAPARRRHRRAHKGQLGLSDATGVDLYRRHAISGLRLRNSRRCDNQTETSDDYLINSKLSGRK